MDIIAYILLHVFHSFYRTGEEVRRFMEGIIKRLTRVGAKYSTRSAAGRFTLLHLSHWLGITNDFFNDNRCLQSG